MFDKLNIVKCIHPGLVVDRELKKRKLKRGHFAISIDEFPQTLGAIIKGKRRMNVALANKIEKALDLEEGYLMVLQALFDVKKLKENDPTKKPDLTKFRTALFWDTSFDLIDWNLQKGAIIERVFERGNDIEKSEILRFYELPETALTLRTETFIRPAIEMDASNILSKEELVAIKMEAIQQGGHKKDFWDIHALMKDYSFSQMMELHYEHYPQTHNISQLITSFTDFSKADGDFTPVCLKGKIWEIIKLDLIDFAEE